MPDCSKCKQFKDQTSFSKNRSAKSGFTNNCKACCAAYQKINKTIVKRANDKYYSKNSVKVNKRSIALRNMNIQKYKEYCKKYQKENSGKMSYHTSKYRTSKLHRTPKWLTPRDLFKIELMYAIADRLSRITKIKHEVDHIIPLQGKNISGLHIFENLQLLTASDNRHKKNRFQLGD